MNRSEISYQFNFDNALDISQNPRDTTHYFTKEGFGFDDFMDINKTYKSQKQSQLARQTSSVFRPHPDSSINVGNDSNLDKYPEKKNNLSIYDSMNPPSNVFDGPSPRFLDGTMRSLDISQTNKEYSIRVSKKEMKIAPSALEIREQPLEMVSTEKIVGKQEKKVVNKLQQEYLEVQGSIRYYRQAIDRMEYQSKRMEIEAEQMGMMISSSSQQAEKEEYARQIRQINRAIEDQTNLEVQLEKMIKQLQEDYDHAISSVKNATFSRPTIVRDEAKALIDEINDIRTQLQGLERDQGSLNLSSTLIPNQLSKNQHQTSRGSRESMGVIKELWEQNRVSEDPRFIQNVKMACFRDEWNLYCNSEIQIRVSYRNCPRVVIHIGNKCSSELQKFMLREEGEEKLSGETIAGKSYFKHLLDITPEVMERLFIKYEISYSPEPQSPTKTVKFFVPTGYSNFGGFMPVTLKEFHTEAAKKPNQYSLPFAPIDKRLLSTVSQAQILMPNLIVDSQELACYGMFVSFFSEDTFISIEQKGEMLRVNARAERWPLLHLLQFIFTV